MNRKQFALCILAMVCATGQVFAADGLASSPYFRNFILNQTKLSLAGGRVVSNCTNGMWVFRQKQTFASGPVREEIQYNGNGVTGAFTYTYQRNGDKADKQKDPKEEFSLDVSSEGRFVLRYSDKDQPEKYFEFTQVPGQSVRLSLPPADKPRVLRASSIWHLLIIHDEDCRKEFLPRLDSLRADWHIARTVQSTQEEMVKMAAASRKPDRKQWDAWVNQLSDPLMMARERADQSLREVGPAVIGYLNRLNMGQLDAEQKSRLRRIVRDLSTQTAEDTPQHVASMLVEDPLVWLALLSRPEQSTRQAAVQQLAVLLNVPIAVDPKAQPDSQAKARDKLRKQIEKIVGESLKPDDLPKPAAKP
jgi:hypothetical protein